MLEKFRVGMGITSINDFRKYDYTTKPKFYEKIFLKSEIDYCLKF